MNFYVKEITFFTINLMCSKCWTVFEKNNEKNCKCEESECKLSMKIIGEGSKCFKFKVEGDQAFRLLNLNEKDIKVY